MDQSAYFEQLRRKRRNDILDAAREMIIYDGIASFNMQKLARRLDLSPVTLYKYFKNSDDILQALIRQFQSDWVVVNARVENFNDPLKALEDFLKIIYSSLMTQKDLLTLFVQLESYAQPQKDHIPDWEMPFPGFPQIEDQLLQLLTCAAQKDLLSPDLDIHTGLHTILDLNRAMIEHMGLMTPETFKAQRPRLETEIEKLIKLTILYIRKD